MRYAKSLPPQGGTICPVRGLSADNRTQPLNDGNSQRIMWLRRKPDRGRFGIWPETITCSSSSRLEAVARI
jgi:hypothetical protein